MDGMAHDIFDALFGRIDAIGINAVQTIYTNLSTALEPVFFAGMTCFIVWWGYEMLFGRAQMTAGAFIWRLGKLILIYSFISNWATYQPLIVKPLLEAPDAFATIVCQSAGGENCGGSGGSITVGLTNIWNAGLSASTIITSAGGWTGVGLFLLAILVLVCVGILVAVAVALLLMGKMTLFLLLAIGPLILCCAIFNFTSHITDGWMRALAQFSILPLIVYGNLAIMLLVLKGSLESVQSIGMNSVSLTYLAPFLLMCTVATLLLLQSINIAQAIAGGARLTGNDTMNRAGLKFTKWGGGKLLSASASTVHSARSFMNRSGNIETGKDAARAQIEAAARDARR